MWNFLAVDRLHTSGKQEIMSYNCMCAHITCHTYTQWGHLQCLHKAGIVVNTQSPIPVLHVHCVSASNLVVPCNSSGPSPALHQLSLWYGWKVSMSVSWFCHEICRLNQTYIHVGDLPGWKDPWGERPMTFEEIGCFLSHHTIWERVSKLWSILLDSGSGEGLGGMRWRVLFSSTVLAAISKECESLHRYWTNMNIHNKYRCIDKM